MTSPLSMLSRASTFQGVPIEQKEERSNRLSLSGKNDTFEFQLTFEEKDGQISSSYRITYLNPKGKEEGDLTCNWEKINARTTQLLLQPATEIQPVAPRNPFTLKLKPSSHE